MIISIHALLAESDRPTANNATTNDEFLSTLSLRRATVLRKVPLLGIKYFYPRSPCGERPMVGAGTTTSPNFYPRSPCGERPCTRRPISRVLHFYPRSPCGERRVGLANIYETVNHFYPRSPCGERRRNSQNVNRGHTISIHALLAESDITL